jgi:predicted dienelactone hydrolase
VGFASLTFDQPDQADPLAWRAGQARLSRSARVLPVDVWYPAQAGAQAQVVTYSGALTGEDGRPVAFTMPGQALSGAPRRPGKFPLVILAHGYGGTPVAMSWLAENLASKGYVVAGPHFNDPAITDATGFIGPLTRRPLDIVFVAGEAQKRARTGAGPFASADADRTVLIGYSMGGYGVLTAAGAPLEPALAALTHDALGPFVRGGPRAPELKVADLRAIVLIAPAGRFPGGEAWGPKGLGAVTTPSLFIVGDQDRTVGYEPGAKTLFDQESRAPRYLLTFENAGHSLGMGPAPAAMRGKLWDQDWFEDPVWRKSRVTGVELHFITAFLDRYVKDDAAKAAYLDVAELIGNRTVWPARPGEAWDEVSSGVAPITVWKGFQRRGTTGLELRFAPATP